MSDYKKNLEENKGATASWCVLPWSHISTRSDGTYRICCNSNGSPSHGIPRDKNGRAFHIEKSDLKSVMNSDMMKKIRKNMLEGRWSEECVRCKREYESGIASRNICERSILAQVVESEKYPGYQKAKKLTRSDGSISFDDFTVFYLDIRFGNLCNLKCVTCGPGDSNQWYEDYEALWGKEAIESVLSANGVKKGKNFFDWNKDSHFLRQVEKNIDHLRKAYIVGGEPLLIESHYNFLKKCIDKGVAEKLNIDYNSNITHIPKKAWELWKHFKSINMGISIDGYGEVNDFIRYPSQWNQIEENLKKLDEAQEKNFNLYITTSVSVLNIWHLPEFMDYILKSNYRRINNSEWSYPLMSPHLVHNPPHLNINILEDHFKEEISEFFYDYKRKISNFDWKSSCDESYYSWDKKIERAHKILDSYIEYMNKIKYSEKELSRKRSQFIYSMDRLDELRKTKWDKVLPKLYENTLKWRKKT